MHVILLCPATNIVIAELLRDGFGEEKYCHCFVVEHNTEAERESKEPVLNGVTPPPLPPLKLEHSLIGYALYFYTYSTWEGRTLFIEDIFVQEEFRGMER